MNYLFDLKINIKMYNLKKTALLAFTAITLFSCNNDDDNIDDKKSEGTHVSAVVKFDHSLRLGELLTLKDKENQDQSIKLTKLKYIISDVKVTATDGSEYEIPNNVGAQLVDLDHSDDNGIVKTYFTGIPNGSYKKITFTVGVSKEVAEGAAEAQERLMELAEADMHWDWNPNSYIFSKIEGSNTNTASTTPTNLQIHIGDKGENFVGSRVVNLEFPENLTVATKISPSVHLKVFIEKIFNPNEPGQFVPFDGVAAHGGSDENAINYADNFANSIVIDHLHANEEAINLEDVEEHDHSEGDGHSHNHTH
ncbi:MbnP family protein [Ochrovirga pacifica]|uniref:MbnP family protein n=1 Tax=Ochrovirga pacifica TaxID=1042376 RepID=UPI0004957738|nr:MbnP family protein [Ochrovirga pacifica]